MSIFIVPNITTEPSTGSYQFKRLWCCLLVAFIAAAQRVNWSRPGCASSATAESCKSPDSDCLWSCRAARRSRGTDWCDHSSQPREQKKQHAAAARQQFNNRLNLSLLAVAVRDENPVPRRPPLRTCRALRLVLWVSLFHRPFRPRLTKSDIYQWRRLKFAASTGLISPFIVYSKSPAQHYTASSGKHDGPAQQSACRFELCHPRRNIQDGSVIVYVCI